MIRGSLRDSEGVFAGAGIVAQKIHRGFGHHDFHDGFAIPGARDRAGFRIRITTATNQWRIADAAGEFAACAASGSSREEAALLVEGYSSNGALIVSAVMNGGMLVFFAAEISLPFGFADQFLRLAKRETGIFGKAFRAFAH